MLDKKQLPFTIAAVVILLVASFYLGRLSVSKTSSNRNFNPASFVASSQGRAIGTNAGAKMQGGINRGNMVSGEIIGKDDQSLTVKLADGGSKIVYFSGKTTIGQTTVADSGALTVGQNVIVSGTANSDGSLVAQMIQIRDESLNNAGPAGFTPGSNNLTPENLVPIKTE